MCKRGAKVGLKGTDGAKGFKWALSLSSCVGTTGGDSPAVAAAAAVAAVVPPSAPDWFTPCSYTCTLVPTFASS